MDLVPTALFPLWSASLLTGWPIMAYYFWTSNRLQEVAPTRKIVLGVCFTTWLVAILLLREVAVVKDIPSNSGNAAIAISMGGFLVPTNGMPVSWHQEMSRVLGFTLAFHALAVFPLICLAAFGAHRFWQRIRPCTEDEEPTSSRIFT